MTSDVSTPKPVEPVDEVLPAKELGAFGLQHVLGMYAGAVAVPLIVGAAFKVSAGDMAVLIAADIFTAGIATMLTCIGIWKFGARLPIMQGCTFAAVGPIVAAAGNGKDITDVFGAIIIAGVIAILLAPVIGKLQALLPAARGRHGDPADRHLAAARRRRLGGRRLLARPRQQRPAATSRWPSAS